MRLSLKTKFTLIIVGVLMVMLGGFSYLKYRHDKGLLIDGARSKLYLAAEIIRNGLVSLMMEGRSSDIRRLIGPISAKDFESARLMRPDGYILSSSDPSEDGLRSTSDLPAEFLVPIVNSVDGHPTQTIFVPIYREKRCTVCHVGGSPLMAVLGVTMSLDETYRRLNDSRLGALAEFGVIVTVLSFILIAITTAMVTDPLGRVLASIRRVEAGDMHVRFSNGEGDEIGAIATGLDDMLSEINAAHRQVEEYQMEAVQRLEKMATIGELAAAIAHEIKNPLAGISGAIQVFAEDFPEGDRRREIIDDVLAEIARLDKAVKDLLAFARPPEPSIIPIPVDVIIERTVRLVTGQARKQSVEVCVELPERPITIQVDPEQIQQVFLNIMMNALHSMPRGGTLTVSAAERAQDGEADVRISDSGAGIAEEEIKNIFRPFYTTKHMGTGLGLTISNNIVEKHNGRLVVSSRAGEGTTFLITLPLAAGER